MTSKAKAKIQSMFDNIATRYDVANSVLSMGIHHLWKRQVVRLVAREERNKYGLDLCTGTGDLIIAMMKLRPQIKYVGGDFSSEMLAVATNKLMRLGLENPLHQMDAMDLPFKSEFDFVTVAFGIRNFEDLEKGLKNIKESLREGGSAYILEFGTPPSKIWNALYSFYQNYIIPVLGYLMTRNYEAYSYLPESSQTFPSDQALVKVCQEVGFSSCEFTPLFGGIAYIYRAIK